MSEPLDNYAQRLERLLETLSADTYERLERLVFLDYDEEYEVGLLCVRQEAQGTALHMVWELYPDFTVMERGVLPDDLAPDGMVRLKVTLDDVTGKVLAGLFMSAPDATLKDIEVEPNPMTDYLVEPDSPMVVGEPNRAVWQARANAMFEEAELLAYSVDVR